MRFRDALPDPFRNRQNGSRPLPDLASRPPPNASPTGPGLSLYYYVYRVRLPRVAPHPIHGRNNMIELRFLNCRIPLIAHEIAEVPTSKRDEVAFVVLQGSEALTAGCWVKGEWRDDKRRPFKSPVVRWYSIGDAHVGN